MRGLVQNGEFIPDAPIRNWEGRRVELKLEPKPSTDPQRRYYRGCIVKMIAAETGMSEEETHDQLKKKFLPEGIESTEDLNTIEKETYHEDCRRFASIFLNMYIPLPREYL